MTAPRTHVDPAFLPPRRPSKPTLAGELDLFGRYQVAPQSVPSGSSEAGADAAAHVQATQCTRVLNALAAYGCVPGSNRYLSRDDLERITTVEEGALCARLGPSGPLLQLETIVAVKRAGRSNEGRKVLGYQLTLKGLREARA